QGRTAAHLGCEVRHQPRRIAQCPGLAAGGQLAQQHGGAVQGFGGLAGERTGVDRISCSVGESAIVGARLVRKRTQWTRMLQSGGAARVCDHLRQQHKSNGHGNGQELQRDQAIPRPPHCVCPWARRLRAAGRAPDWRGKTSKNMAIPMCATSRLAPRQDGKIACDFAWLSDNMFSGMGARSESRFAAEQSVTSAQRDLLNTIPEAGQVTRRCASAVAAVRHSTLCLLLGLLGAAAPAQAAGFNFASLQSLLSHQNIGSVEELLAALPAAQRNRYALVFESRSLQGASPENPRVILFGPDARFIVTFNGNAAQRGFRVVETMEF